jgi:leucyl/phenylalanyl-tRNA--protein transferase
MVKFPALENANEDGLLAMGGDLSVETLVSAYSQGIFPWFNEDQPILWWSPDPRLVLFPKQFKTSRSLKKTLRRSGFNITSNLAFERVIDGCALRGLNNQLAKPAETWISCEMKKAYVELFHSGFAHSVEVWDQGNLVGGLYGLALGRVFFGESMFSDAQDSSKAALMALCQELTERGFTAIDCQVASDHLFSLGAQEIPRDQFTDLLADIDIDKPLKGFSINISSNDLLARQNLL